MKKKVAKSLLICIPILILILAAASVLFSDSTKITFNETVTRIDIGYYECVPSSIKSASTDDSEIIGKLTAYLSELKPTARSIEERDGGTVYIITVYYTDGTIDELSVLKDDGVLRYHDVFYDVNTVQIDDFWEYCMDNS